VQLSSIGFGCEVEISHLDIEVLIKENIFWLEVPVANTSGIVNVRQELQNLLEVVSSNWLRELASIGDHVEDLALLGDLQEDVLDLLVVLELISHTYHFDDTRVVNSGHERELVLKVGDELMRNSTLRVVLEDFAREMLVGVEVMDQLHGSGGP